MAAQSPIAIMIFAFISLFCLLFLHLFFESLEGIFELLESGVFIWGFEFIGDDVGRGGRV